MNDLEDRIREALHNPPWQVPTWPDPMPRVRRAARRQRARLAIGAGALAALVAAAVVTSILAVPSSTGARPAVGTVTSPSPPPPSPPPPGWVRHSAGQGVSIDTPAAWNFNGDPVPALLGPGMLFAVGTGPVPSGGSCGPTAALKAMPAAGALFALTEYSSAETGGEPYTFPPRPERLRLGSLGSGPAECWGVKIYVILFEDGGRYFEVQAVFGPHAAASLRAEMLRSLDSLHVAPLPTSEQPAAQCRAAQWTACPQAAWVYEVINRAHVFHLGHQGTQAILGLARKRSFALWTTPTRPAQLNRCRNVAGARVCRSGTRVAWPVHGLWLLVKPALSPYASLRTGADLPNGNVLTRLVRASQSVRVAAP
jgi:hypothetical protein